MSDERFMTAAKDVASLVNQGKIDSARAKLLQYVLDERDKERQASHSAAEKKVGELASFIMSEIPGEPSQSQGAVETAIRVMRAAQSEPSASEALFLFMGWLTSRDKATGPFSARHHAGEACDLVAEYYKGQGWKEPRSDSAAWGKMEVKAMS